MHATGRWPGDEPALPNCHSAAWPSKPQPWLLGLQHAPRPSSGEAELPRLRSPPGTTHRHRYNVLLALFSALSFYVTATALGWDYGTGAWLRRQTGDTPQPLFQCPSPVWDSKLFTWTAKAFYYSKYVEYLDTAWLVLKGKKVSFLQAFHHFGAPWDVYLGIRLHNEGVWIFMFFNSFIHTIMYTYYGLTAAGYKFKAKPLITAMQICQFVGGFLLVWDYINVPCFNSDKGKVRRPQVPDTAPQHTSRADAARSRTSRAGARGRTSTRRWGFRRSTSPGQAG